MNTGIIVLHCWDEMRHPVELNAMENIKILLANSKLPVLGSVITRQDIKQLIPNCVDEDLMKEENKPIIKQWLSENDLDTVILVGLHYNLCIRQLESRLFELCEEMGRSWNNNFTVKVIEDCTAASMEDKIYAMLQYEQIGETHNLTTLQQWTSTL